jgi:uncharacterized repeat protein (TIGR01451 family)
MNRYIRNCLLLAAIFTSVVGVAPAEPQTVQAQAGTWYVSNSGSDANACNTPAAPCATIQAAINKAASSDIVKVAMGVYLGSGGVSFVFIDRAITLTGGWEDTFVSRVGVSLLSGTRSVAVIQTDRNTFVNANIENFIIQDGNTGVWSGPGTTTLKNVEVRNNRGAFGGVNGSYGSLRIVNSSVHNNVNYTFHGSGGGVVYYLGNLTIINSTISNNRADFSGGGVSTGETNVNIVNSSIVNNHAVGGKGGGIYNWGTSGTTILHNSLVSINTAAISGPDCAGESLPFASVGYNIIGNTSGCTYNAGMGDLLNISPQIGELQGSPPYRPLLPGSPAINAGNPAGCQDNAGNPIPNDQRGVPRIGRCDIGAYEAGLSVVKLAGGAFQPGNVITYTITLKNEDDNLLAGALITDVMPPLLGFVPNSLTASSGTASYSNQMINWTGSISATTTTLTYQAQIDPGAIGATIINQVVADWQGRTYVTNSTIDTFSRVYLPVLARNYCANFFDDFSNSFSGWPTGESDFVLAQYLNGEYRVQSKQPYLFLFRSPGCERDNYVVEADMRWDGAASSDIGLLFGVMPNFSQYYFATIDTNYQVYAIFRRNSNGTFSFVAPWAQAGAIRPGTQTNHMKIDRNGSQITLEINGIAVGAWYDGTITGPTRTGVAMAPYEDAPVADARFDNFRVTTIGTGTLALPGLTPERAADPGQPLPADFLWRLPEHEWILNQP